MNKVEHILILGGGPLTEPFLDRLHKHHIKTSRLLGVESITAPEVAVGNQIVLGMAAGSEPSDWKAAARAVNGILPFQRVVSVNDPFLGYAAAIADDLRLPWYGETLMRKVHTKTVLREALREAGIEETPFAHVATPEEIVEFGNRHGWPLIVKPSRGVGSVGVTKIPSPEAAHFAFHRVPAASPLTNGQAMVEPFFEGAQFSVETLSEGGEHVVLSITRKFSHPEIMIEAGQCLPSGLPKESMSGIRNYVISVLNALGVQHGPAFTELVLTENGPRVFEMHLRMAGDEMVTLFRLAYGLDLLDLVARQLLGESVLPEVRKRLAAPSATTAAIWFAFADADGIIQNVTGSEVDRATPGISDVQIHVKNGERVRKLRSCYDRHAHVIAHDKDPARAVAAARRRAAAIKFLVETGKTGSDIV